MVTAFICTVLALAALYFVVRVSVARMLRKPRAK